ncbi:MAG TPA: class I SAM-dependent methyltransferase [Candidatus Brocadiaceae bacterium]
MNSLVDETGASEIYEVGCGEGNLSIELAKQNKIVRACDFSEQIISIANKNAKKNNVKINFKTVSIYELTPERDSAALVVCCEVLEHLENPERALAILSELSPQLIISVPNEPLWSILNIVRGKYFSSFGVTPGHIQKWSRKNFLALLSCNFEILKVLNPIPWTMVLCKSKADSARPNRG